MMHAPPSGEPAGSRPRTVEMAGAGIPLMAIDEKLFRCWHGGLGIRATMLAITRTHGVLLTFEQVHQHFITLSQRFAG